MANSLDASLVNTILAQRAITKVQNKLGWLKAFTNDFSDETRDVRSRSILVPYALSASAYQSNATDFESGDTTTNLKTITLNHISKSFYITSHDFGKGVRLEQLADINMSIVANQIEATVFALITEANFATSIPASLSSVAAGGTTAALLHTLWGTLPGEVKNCVLSDSYFAPILPSDLNSFDITKTNSGYGFDYLGRSGNGFASAGSKVVGFACNPNAIVIGAAVPEYTPGVAEMLDSQVVEVPGLGLSIQSNVWASSKSRNTWASFDVLLGAAVGCPSSMTLMKSI